MFPYLFHLFLCFYLIPYLFLPFSLPVSICFLTCSRSLTFYRSSTTCPQSAGSAWNSQIDEICVFGKVRNKVYIKNEEKNSWTCIFNLMSSLRQLSELIDVKLVFGRHPWSPWQLHYQTWNKEQTMDYDDNFVSLTVVGLLGIEFGKLFHQFTSRYIAFSI